MYYTNLIDLTRYCKMSCAFSFRLDDSGSRSQNVANSTFLFPQHDNENAFCVDKCLFANNYPTMREICDVLYDMPKMT